MAELRDEWQRQPQAAPTAASIPGARGAAPLPWQLRRREAAEAGLPADLLSPLCADADLAGIERRLPRRAEALWNRLRGDCDLPPARATGLLLAPPFATLALLVTRPRRGQPEIAYAGSEIGWLGPLTVGPALPDRRATAPIPARLAALALESIEAGGPRHLDSDYDPDVAGPGPGILFRAVALPLAPDPDSGLAGLAVAVLSWRKLLSRDETDALHSELQAAMAWLGTSGKAGPEH